MQNKNDECAKLKSFFVCFYINLVKEESLSIIKNFDDSLMSGPTVLAGFVTAQILQNQSTVINPSITWKTFSPHTLTVKEETF